MPDIDADAMHAVATPFINEFSKYIELKSEGFSSKTSLNDVYLIRAMRTAHRLKCGAIWYMSRRFRFGVIQNKLVGDVDIFTLLKDAPGIADCIPSASIAASIDAWSGGATELGALFIDVLKSYRANMGREMLHFHQDVFMNIVNAIKGNNRISLELVESLASNTVGVLSEQERADASWLQRWTFFLGHRYGIQRLLFFFQQTFEQYSSPLLHRYDGSDNFFVVRRRSRRFRMDRA